MKQTIAAVLITIAVLFSAAAAADMASINGYSWSKMQASEKASVVISIARAINEINAAGDPAFRVEISPEKATMLCIKTDQFYSLSANLETPIINAWLNIAKAI